MTTGSKWLVTDFTMAQQAQATRVTDESTTACNGMLQTIQDLRGPLYSPFLQWILWQIYDLHIKITSYQ